MDICRAAGSSRGHCETDPHSPKGLAIFFTVYFFKRLPILNANAGSNTFSQWVTPRNVGKVKEERNLESERPSHEALLSFFLGPFPSRKQGFFSRSRKLIYMQAPCSSIDMWQGNEIIAL